MAININTPFSDFDKIFEGEIIEDNLGKSLKLIELDNRIRELSNTQYYSTPIEVLDINGVHMTSKFSYKDELFGARWSISDYNPKFFENPIALPVKNYRSTTQYNPEFFGGGKFSGSGQYTAFELKYLLTYLIKEYTEKDIFINKIYVVDLRAEPHIFINGEIPMSLRHPLENNVQQYFIKGCNADKASKWCNFIDTTNYGSNNTYVKYELKSAIGDKKTIMVPFTGEKNDDAKTETDYYYKFRYNNVIKTEEEVTNELKNYTKNWGVELEYKYYPVIDHYYPCGSVLKEFIKFLEMVAKEPNSHIHFHCKGGAGRTTTAMSIYQFLIDAKDGIYFEGIPTGKKNQDELKEKVVVDLISGIVKLCDVAQIQNIIGGAAICKKFSETFDSSEPKDVILKAKHEFYSILDHYHNDNTEEFWGKIEGLTCDNYPDELEPLSGNINHDLLHIEE